MISRLFGVAAARLVLVLVVLSGALSLSATASQANEYTFDEIVDSGHRFFGATSGGLASVSRAVPR